MFKDKSVAESVLAELESCSRILDNSVRIARELECDTASFESYRILVGLSMGDIYIDLKRPIYIKHPDLEPEELKNGN